MNGVLETLEQQAAADMIAEGAPIFPRDPACPEALDQAHERLGHTAPRVTPADMEANVADVRFFNAAEAIHGADMILGSPSQVLPESLRLLTVCVIVLRNGFVLVGHSAPASPANFNTEIGQRFARENAMKQLWPLMGYALREKLSETSLPKSVDER